MSNFAKAATVILILQLFCSTAEAQTSMPVGSRSRRDENQAEAQRRQEADLNRQMRDLNAVTNSSRIRYPKAASKVKPLSKEERTRIASIRAPDTADATKYKNFLRQKNTGLFRLFADFNCQAKNIIRVGGDCANVVLDSWSYSFRQKDYSGDELSDVKFKDEKLFSEGFLTQGIFVRLGDVPLENVSTVSDGIKFLLDFKPEVQSEKAKMQFARIAKGIEDAGYKYVNSVKVEENTTYALRTVAYQNQTKTIFRLFPETNAVALKFLKLEYDKRIDLTVAFRVVRRDETTDSITILWKQLNRRNAPEMVFAENKNPSDFKTGK